MSVGASNDVVNSLENFGHLRRPFNLKHCLLAILILDSDSNGLGAPLWLFIFVGHGYYYAVLLVGSIVVLERWSCVIMVKILECKFYCGMELTQNEVPHTIQYILILILR